MICPKCGYTTSPADHFCENCGYAMVATAVASDVPQTSVCHCPPGQSKPDEEGYCQVCGVRCVPEEVATRKHVALAIDARLAVVSDVGRRHPVNEDTGAVARGAGNVVALVVADGVSTSANSSSASEAAVEAAMCTMLAIPDSAALSDTVRSAIEQASKAVLALPFTEGDGDGPLTTIVAALCRDGHVAVGWVGDSRAYLVGKDAEEQLTVDDSWVEEVIRSGEMPREQAIADRRAHYVTQVLGMRDQQIDIHIMERELPEDCILLLCSDGLWNYFQENGEIANAVRQHNAEDALSQCQYLVDAANGQGGKDNITVAMLI